MSSLIWSNMVASISELKANPMAAVNSAHGEPIAILNRNHPVFYCVPAKLYEAMMELIDDAELTKIIKNRMGEKEIAIDVNDL